MNRELRETLKAERALYLPDIITLRSKIIAWYARKEQYEMYRYICILRTAEFYQKKGKLVRQLYYLRKSNILGKRFGFVILPGVLGKGVRLWHRSITIHPASKIGDGCVFHGDNCVGNNGITNDCPVLGKNVDLGVGAKVIGPVTLADDIRVGANAVVTKSFTEPGITIAGIPAVKVKPRAKES